MRIRLLAIPLAAVTLVSACRPTQNTGLTGAATAGVGPLAPTPVTTTVPPNTAQPTPVLTVTPTSMTLEYGKSAKATATLDGVAVNAAWTSNFPDTARVDVTGEVTCLGGGEAKVSARRIGDDSPTPTLATVAVTCLDPLKVTVTPSLSFDHTIGRTGCDQSAGIITIKMVTGPSAFVVVQSNDDALYLKKNFEQILDRNGEARFEVFFNCTKRTSFVGEIIVKVAGVEYQVLVNASVHP